MRISTVRKLIGNGFGKSIDYERRRQKTGNGYGISVITALGGLYAICQIYYDKGMGIQILQVDRF